VFSKEYATLNLGRVADWIQQGRLDPAREITIKELVTSRCVHRLKDGVKLLADGADQLQSPVKITVSRASEEAVKRIEDLGGSVNTRYYTPSSMRRVLKGEAHPTLRVAEGYTYRLPDPAGRREREFYMDKKKRGYLAHLVKEGESASLYWKRPDSQALQGAGASIGERASKGGAATGAGGKALGENRVW
jgi:large subunit ribosomal protein L15